MEKTMKPVIKEEKKIRSVEGVIREKFGPPESYVYTYRKLQLEAAISVSVLWSPALRAAETTLAVVSVVDASFPVEKHVGHNIEPFTDRKFFDSKLDAFDHAIRTIREQSDRVKKDLDLLAKSRIDYETDVDFFDLEVVAAKNRARHEYPLVDAIRVLNAVRYHFSDRTDDKPDVFAAKCLQDVEFVISEHRKIDTDLEWSFDRVFGGGTFARLKTQGFFGEVKTTFAG